MLGNGWRWSQLIGENWREVGKGWRRSAKARLRSEVLEMAITAWAWLERATVDHRKLEIGRGEPTKVGKGHRRSEVSRSL